MRPNQNTVAGRRLPRLDGAAKATGRYVYGTDVTLPGTLYGKVLRSDMPHARLKRLDVSAARAMRGVRAVITSANVPQVRYGNAVKDQTVFATDTVRFVGHPLAAVAADTLEIAEQALSAIVVELEPLPPLFDPEAALAPGAPLLHPDWQDYVALPVIAREGNVAGRSRMRHGDVEAAFAQAHRVYEHRFTTALQHAGYTEPRAASAAWDSTGVLTVWSNGQLPFEVQATLADILELPVSRIRVVVPGIGGGFGGKLRIGVEHFAALLARQSGRPVKMITTSEEELIAAHPRQAAIITLKTAVSADGRILARQGRVVVDCGACSGSGPGTGAVALQCLVGPYRTPNLLMESLAVYTNKVPSGSFRAPSGPMANFAVESQMDIIAKDLGIDPLEIRLRNIVREGDLGPAGEVLKDVSIEECLRRAADAISWHDRAAEPGRGKGIACSWWMTTGGSSAVFIKLNGDGTVALTSGAVELGTGALTGAAQILAEELSLDLEDVRVAAVDTLHVPYDYGAQGSRTAFSVGNACRAAAADLRQQLFALVAAQHGVPAEEMMLRDKCVVAGDKRIPLAEIARQQYTGGGLVARGTALNPPPAYDPARVENHPLPVWNTPSFHAHAADVSVDTETGEVTINRYVVAQDVGYAINPTYIEGQIEGGVSQGLGQALSEEIVYQDGRVLNANLTDYKMPTSLDVPPIESILVECPSAAGPYGAKGVGEPPCIEPPATIANAVAAATGLWITSLPITAEKILLGLKGEP
ncbi:xanthine dehydrogenase family protein molybdopterin-binding subunit [Vineibacter terrae]|uniref:xanthine dehydrogenase family protein molybdopterin-binding subunit n=1 Tax=Vineibacter terrae TaxID=2586908 RepID=UPI002E2F2D6B|nr:xanthine dehydrogenase family protein molybdopterin-binding subunit [Vineibacter terrae]HEX2886953.1 xanthine dehydrogenase family protein molybdopterin-binding subunit [Vineibacter terrae]